MFRTEGLSFPLASFPSKQESTFVDGFEQSHKPAWKALCSAVWQKPVFLDNHNSLYVIVFPQRHQNEWKLAQKTTFVYIHPYYNHQILSLLHFLAAPRALIHVKLLETIDSKILKI